MSARLQRYFVLDTASWIWMLVLGGVVITACDSSSNPLSTPFLEPTPTTTPAPLSTPFLEPTPTTTPAGIVFKMKDTYRLGEPIEVIIHNRSNTDTYYYQFAYPACYNLKFFDASVERRPDPSAPPGGNPPVLLLPGQFIVPRGTHCDLISEKELRPREEVVLFTWDQDMCIKDRWGCIESIQVNPGAYRVIGEFAQRKGVIAPGVSRENARITLAEWKFVIVPP